jgi:hypothetical protein
MTYNIDKGGNTSEESEILEPIHACLRELLERDRLGKGHLMEYTDHDVVAATLVFSHILGNRLAHKLTRENVNLDYSKELATGFGISIINLAKMMSGVDVATLYKGNEEKG